MVLAGGQVGQADYAPVKVLRANVIIKLQLIIAKGAHCPPPTTAARSGNGSGRGLVLT